MDDGARFEFGRCLGRGGFGEVYQAVMRTQGGVQRTVAVKVLREHAHDVESAIRRLRDEAHLLAALHHRAIVQVHDLVELDGRVALVTEYLPGADLDRIVREDGQIPPRPALEVIGEVAGALHAAYTAPAPGTRTPMRLVHRDIKPANLRVTPTGGVKVLDFGIARSPEVAREARTTTGIVVGTVGYFSPERLTEDLPQPSDDVYALGCVLYEVLTGLQLYRNMKRADLFRLAFHPDNHAAFLRERLTHAPAGLRSWPALQPVLAGALAADPEERFTAGELEAACFDLVRDVGGPSLREWCRDRTWTEPDFVTGPFEGRAVAASGGHTTPLTASPTAPLARPPAQAPPSVSPAAAPPARPSTPRPRPTPEPPTPSRGWLSGLGALLIVAGGAGAAGWYLHTTPPTPVSAPTAAPPTPEVAPPPPATVPTPAPSPAPPVDPEPAPAPSASAAAPSRLPANPDAVPPRPLPASLHGGKLLTLRSLDRLELRDLDSPAKPVVSFARPGAAATDVCLRGDTLALVMGGTVEVRRRSTDTVIDRMRPGGRVVDRVLCLEGGQVAAVSRAPRIGNGGGTGEIVWWDDKGRVRGRLLPPAGVVDARAMGDRVLVLDGEGGVREWLGQGSPAPELLPLEGRPTGVTPSLGGPAWAVSTESACSLDGTCVAIDGSRGLVTSGVGWVAVAGADRVSVIDGIQGVLIRELPARATELMAQPDGTLLVVEPDGVRVLDPVSGEERAQRRW